MSQIKWNNCLGKKISSSNNFDIIECEKCQFKHVVPLPSEEELEEVYSHEYYTSEKPFYIDLYLEDKDWWDAIYEERYNTLEKLILKSSKSILDVGSGPGLFLALGRSRGWKVKGIEPSKKAANFSRKELNLDIENFFLDEGTAQKIGKYDVVHMGEVLEHLPNPAKMLEISKNILNDKGIITLIVPNDFNPIQKILNKHHGFNPWWVAPPHHLNYFNHKSLKNLVEKVGFKFLKDESTFPIDLFLLMGKNYISNDTIGREVHALRKQLDLNLLEKDKDFRRNLYDSFKNLGIGREIVLYAQKDN